MLELFIVLKLFIILILILVLDRSRDAVWLRTSTGETPEYEYEYEQEQEKVQPERLRFSLLPSKDLQRLQVPHDDKTVLDRQVSPGIIGDFDLIAHLQLLIRGANQSQFAAVT